MQSSIDLALQKISALKTEHETHINRIKAWEEQIKEREIREKRRIAPGYLDTDQRLLVPTRAESPNVDIPIVYADGEDINTKELRRAYRSMGI